MLSLPDFDEKQILIIESFDTKNINFENDNLVIKEKNIIKNKISLYKIFAIFLIWEVTITSVLIRKFQDFWISIILMKKKFSSLSCNLKWNWVKFCFEKKTIWKNWRANATNSKKYRKNKSK